MKLISSSSFGSGFCQGGAVAPPCCSSLFLLIGTKKLLPSTDILLVNFCFLSRSFCAAQIRVNHKFHSHNLSSVYQGKIRHKRVVMTCHRQLQLKTKQQQVSIHCFSHDPEKEKRG